MDEIDLTISTVEVKAKTRNLKVKYTLEAAQDLKIAHSIDSMGELFTLLERNVEDLPDYNRCMKALHDREREEKLKEILK